MNAIFDITGIRLETNRLILREWNYSDLDDFYEYCKVPGVGEMAGWEHHPNIDKSKEILTHFIEGKHVFALVYKENNKVIGSLGIEKYGNEDRLTEFLNYKGREIGYVLSKEYWGRGLMVEAVSRVIDYLFNELDYDFLFCGHFDFNKQSRRVQEKLGFVPYRKLVFDTRMGTKEPGVLNLLLNPKKDIKLNFSHLETLIYHFDMEFRHFDMSYYELLVSFLKEINKEDKTHINWNWARLEWMIGHPEFDRSLISKIGLWFDNNKLVAVAIYDMYLGEASILTLKEYQYLNSDLLNYAYLELRNEEGIGIAINDNDKVLKKLASLKGYLLTPQKEVILSLDLTNDINVPHLDGFVVKEMDPKLDEDEIGYILYQGFDHGDDIEEYRNGIVKDLYPRIHAKKNLTLEMINKEGKGVGFCSMWYESDTDYAYLEPLAVIPSYRNKGIAKALIYELASRVKAMGAKSVVVISDMEFYRHLGFKEIESYSFYYKDQVIEVNNKKYLLKKLLGKGKGGYSYLAEIDDQEVVLKRIHHEPCDYYQFGNKIEAEPNDYKRLVDTGIRIPKLIDVDKDKEIIVKEYIKGETVFNLVKEDKLDHKYIEQVNMMAILARKHNLNIDYFPTNFIINNDLLYYIDYECNEYKEEWNYSNWGYKYWSKTPEFLNYLANNKYEI